MTSHPEGDAFGAGTAGDRVLAVGAADAAVFEPAERQRGVHDQRGVAVHHAGLDRLGHPQHPPEVAVHT